MQNSLSVIRLNTDHNFLLYAAHWEMQEPIKKSEKWQKKVLVLATTQWAYLFFFCGLFCLSFLRWGCLGLQAVLPIRLHASQLCESCRGTAELWLVRSGCLLGLHCVFFPLPTHFSAPLQHTLEQAGPVQWFCSRCRETSLGGRQKARLNLNEVYWQGTAKVKLFLWKSVKLAAAVCCKEDFI